MQLISRCARLCFVALLAPSLASCDWSPALTSDPAHWSPTSSGPLPDAATEAPDGAVGVDPACLDTPPYDERTTTSSADALSHLPGVPCLEGCHEAGGSARSVFAAGGTIYESQTSRKVASGGFVDGVGGTRLAVDRCGNVYATKTALRATIPATAPFITSPTYRRMDKTLRGVKNPGSCNQSGCHDFSTRLRWGIYF